MRRSVVLNFLDRQLTSVDTRFPDSAPWEISTFEACDSFLRLPFLSKMHELAMLPFLKSECRAPYGDDTEYAIIAALDRTSWWIRSVR